ncbi:hypothetical protein NHX12_002469 [Muraenolepis orangiensis]|uniref:F-actin monooxygenase n=1 Tax=Muraenolepis orangiensis TaxID=630683 RepID=A0A9Q0DZJ0_9TELE|nr:hypothetical protein NHX12_002469 [Muraenolepis orangiensis]
MGETEDQRTVQAGQLFETFVQATTCKGTLQAFSILCRQMDLDPLDYTHFYGRLKAAVSSWKVKGLWTKLDKRAAQKVYNHGKACQGTKCLIVGGGPCGLRMAIELVLLGCKVVVIEKRDTFSRNNVLHLWPYTIHDLRALGAKKFYGKFCAGSLDHISIRQLQLMLTKVCLILGVEIHVNVEFAKLLEPPEDQSDTDSPGWRAEIRPPDHPVSQIDFDVVIGADGRKTTLDGFSRKEFRGKLAIAITANFVNRNTTAEASVEEISGVAFIFNQKFFLELKEETGIDLENIVYYKDNTHYFVMTAKKQSLLDKGVIINDFMETERLLSIDNIDHEALLSYAREAADFGTNYQLPTLDYALNHYGQSDVCMFDFTSMYAAENAALLREKHGHRLLVALVGDSLQEPFWPMGTGCARGFLGAFDTAWMVRGWTQGRSPLDVLAESIDPSTRYPNLNSSCIRPHQVRHLLMNGQQDSYRIERRGPSRMSTNLPCREAEVRQSELLTWCQQQTQGYRGVDVTNLSSSWKDGLALCALIHHQRPELLDFESLTAGAVAANNQQAFDLAEREFGVQPVTTGKEVALEQRPDQLLMVLYLSKLYEAFKRSPGCSADSKEADENNEKSSGKTNHTLLKQQPHRKRIPKNDKKLEDNDSTHKRRRKGTHYLEELSCQSAPLAGADGELQENKVRSMATLLAKFEDSSSMRVKNKPSIYLRLLEDPNAVTRPISPVNSPTKTPPPQNGYDQSPFLSWSKSPRSPSRSPSPNACAGKASTREFSRRSIKERAGILCSMFPGSSTEPTEPRTSSFSLSSSSHPVPQPSSPGVSSATPLPSHLPRTLQGPEDRRYKSLPKPAPESERKRCPPHLASPPPVLLVAASVEFGGERFSRETLEAVNGSKLTQSVQEKSNSRQITRKPVARSDSCPAGPEKYSKERTVGKVSSAIDAKAQKLAILYETDHRPNATPRLPDGLVPPPSSVSLTCLPDGLVIPPSLQRLPDGLVPPPSSVSLTRLPDGLVIPPSLQRLPDGLVPPPSSVSLTVWFSPPLPPSSVSLTCLPDGLVIPPSLQRLPDGLVPPPPPPSSVSLTHLPRQSGPSRSSLPPGVSLTVWSFPFLAPSGRLPDGLVLSALSQGLPRKDGPPGLGGSDTCHFCLKRVYIMERLSAEGYFFHRECFRCDVCRCTLRPGTHSYDSQQGRFYCKTHAQQRLSAKPDQLKKRMATNGFSAGGLHAPSSGTLISMLRRGLSAGRSVCVLPGRVLGGVCESASAMRAHLRSRSSDYAFLYELLSLALPLISSMHQVVGQMYQEAQKEAPPPSPGQGAQTGIPGAIPVEEEERQDMTEALADTDSHKDSKPPGKTNRWKRKIRAAFPLLFVKHLHSRDKDRPQSAVQKQPAILEVDGEDKDSLPGGEPSEATTTTGTSSSPKKRLMMTQSEKEKLLDWGLPLDPPHDTATAACSKPQVPVVVAAAPQANPSQTEAGGLRDPVPSDQSSSSAPSGFQLFAESVRRSFSLNRSSNNCNPATTVITSRPDGPCKPRPTSEGSFSLNSLFGRGQAESSGSRQGAGPQQAGPPQQEPGPSQQEPGPPQHEPGPPQQEPGPPQQEEDLSVVLRRLSLVSRRGSTEAPFSDDMAALPRRRLNFFSSLRIKKREATEGAAAAAETRADGRDGIRTILANLRNKASSQQQLEESLSSGDEDPHQAANQKVSSERLRRRQEKTVAQQAKREQLKRLHRAQAIQRHLEEVGERQREVEERGVVIEKTLRGETGESHQADEEVESQLHQSWFKLVLEKNQLARYESELMIFAQELELQDTQCRLQQDLRRRMAIEDTVKTSSEIRGEKALLAELMRTVEQRDTLVSLLEEQRLREKDEDRDLESLSRGYELRWSPGQSLGWWDHLEEGGMEG